MTKPPKGKAPKSDGKPAKNLPPWLQAKGAKAPAKGTKGGKAPKSSNPFAKKK
jgi:hypothetical protein